MMNLSGCLVIVWLLVLTSPEFVQAGTYEEATSLLDNLIYNSGYKPQVRPLLNQSDVLEVYLIFELLSIVEVNDVFQSFTCNGFLGFFWSDQILRWNASDYGGVSMITPESSAVFRPRIALLNTMGERDLFGQDNAPVVVRSNGLTSWIPGSIFHVSCKLDLTNYPFDEQTCKLDMIIMDFQPSMLKFVVLTKTAGLHFFTENGEWQVKSTNVTTEILTVTGDPLSSIVVTFKLRRRPEFLVLSVLLPIVFLSLLNLMVFVIPVDSGEKIGFGITVLLALSVFMSIISAMLPRSAESMPLMIRYIFCLLIISLLTVVDSIIIVRLHHMEEKGEQLPPVAETKNLSSYIPKVMTPSLRQTMSPLESLRSFPEDQDSRSGSGSRSTSPHSDVSSQSKVKTNRYKMVGTHIDLISLVLFGIVWVAVTVEFMISAAAHV
ncbi:hypothetical protein RRG08_047970 [Elysia crispata]|uniref:Uncharacterized protein n=1 Tax=Elysia crispata TaxID=231223 RepID=A0AAE0ZW81_9GAST|nr:hypothetical protein RRG08_047970 [Elysia crispata]